MKIYKTQQEVDADIVDNVLTIEGDVRFEFNLKIAAKLVVSSGDIDAWDIKARDIDARDIKAWNIKARDIDARDINASDIDAWNIKARDINAWDIKARDINARDIKARDINAWNIDAWDIDARDISFFAVCIAYTSFVCKSIIGRRENAKYFCLDKEVEIKKY